MASIDFQIEGVDAVKAKLDGLVGKITQAIAARQFQFGERIMARSKEQYVPVDTGTLMSTGHVQLPVIDGSTITTVLGYGGPSAGYALQVHEDLTPKNWTRPGSGPKYLEIPARELTPEYPGEIAEAIKDVLS